MKLKIFTIIIAVTIMFLSCGKDGNGPTGPQNIAPVLTEIADQTVNAGETENIELSATDADGDLLNFSIPTNPGFLSISGYSQTGDTASATLIIAPEDTFSGTFNATVQVSDGNGGIDNTNFSIEVYYSGSVTGENTTRYSIPTFQSILSPISISGAPQNLVVADADSIEVTVDIDFLWYYDDLDVQVRRVCGTESEFFVLWDFGEYPGPGPRTIRFCAPWPWHVNGLWKLYIFNLGSYYDGYLNEWSITIWW